MISTQPETSESESEDEVEPKPDPEKKKVCDTYESMNNHPKKSKHQKQIDCLDLTYSSDEDEDEEESLTPKKKKKKTSLSFTMQPKKEKEKKSALLIRHEGEMKPVSLSLPPKKEKKPLPSMAPTGHHGYGHVPLLLPPQFTHHHHSLSQPQMIHMPPASTGLMMNENGCMVWVWETIPTIGTATTTTQVSCMVTTTTQVSCMVTTATQVSCSARV